MNTVTKITIAVVLTACIFFYAGIKYNQAHATPSGGAASQRTFATRGARGGAGGGFTAGTVLSKDAQSITISMMGGGSQIVFVSSSTPVMKTVTGTFDDLAVGQSVLVTGSTNSDGSLTARSIEVRQATSTSQ